MLFPNSLTVKVVAGGCGRKRITIPKDHLREREREKESG